MSRTKMFLALTAVVGISLNTASLVKSGPFGSGIEPISVESQQLMQAGWYKCENTASACKKCKSTGGGCGTCTQVPNTPLKACVGALPPFGHSGCDTAAKVKHCKFVCLPDSCAEKQGGGNCGNYFTLAGTLGCDCPTAGAACTVTTCTDSNNTGQICYECE